MANLNEDIIRNHINKIQEIQNVKPWRLDQFPPDLADIIVKLQKNPDLVIKVKNFLASIIVEDIKVPLAEQVMS